VSQEKLGYDMRCEGENSHLLVEIKGTRGSGWSVTVTSNEVNTAEEKDVDLFIANKIKISGVSSGEYICEGGDILRLSPWKPRDPHSSLKATEYQFTPNTNTSETGPISHRTGPRHDEIHKIRHKAKNG